MVTINARYGFKEPRTRFVQRPDDPLYRAFKKWLDEHSGYGPQRDWLEDKEIDTLLKDVPGLPERHPGEFNAMVAQNRDHPNIWYAGWFLSGCYRATNAKEIEFDPCIDARISNVGRGLPKDKTLILKDNTVIPCNGAFGTVINEATVSEIIHWMHGSFINFGKAGGVHAKKVINYGEMDRADGNHTTFVNYGTIGAMHGNIVVNLGNSRYISGYSDIFNFRRADKIENYLFGPHVGCRVFNTGEAVKIDSKDSNVVIMAIADPKSIYTGEGIFFDSKDCKKVPGLEDDLRHMEEVVETFRHAKYPECLQLLEKMDTGFGLVGTDSNFREYAERRILPYRRPLAMSIKKIKRRFQK